MRLLCWDTSAKTGAIAAIEWDPASREGWSAVRLVSEWSLSVDLTHSDRLLWGIHQTLESARWRLADVDVLGVGVGPGSFTGLRVGITTARTLAHSLQKPLVGVSSLAALARPVALWLSCTEKPRGGERSRAVVIAAQDACKGELFALWGSARSVSDCAVRAQDDFPGLWKRGVEEKVIDGALLVKSIRKKLSEPGASGARWALIGDAGERYPDVWKALPRARKLELPATFLNQVQGRYLAMLAWEALQAGIAREALHVHPQYLRAPDAELKLKQGLLPPGPTRGNSH